jgi:K+-sensing histidine kinase KdpD
MNQKAIDFTKTSISLFFLAGILIGAGILIWSIAVFSLDKVSFLFKYIEESYKKGDLPLPLIISVVTAIATIITAIVTTLITKSNELRLQVRTEQRDKKALIYEELTEFGVKLKAGKIEPQDRLKPL